MPSSPFSPVQVVERISQEWAFFAYFALWGGRISLQYRLRGGEGGIRTLGTGVSPYNGLANQSFSLRSLVVKHLQSDPMPLSRAQGLSFGNYCAPLCAPILTIYYEALGFAAT